MDALRHNVAVTERSLKACSFRQARVQADLHAVNKALKAVVAEVKSIAGTEVEAAAKKQEEDIRVKQLEERTLEAETAKEAFHEHRETRPWRKNKRDMIEVATAKPQVTEIIAAAQPICPVSISAFHADCKSAFADIEAMTTFPEPPAALCAKLACTRGKNDRALAACPCNIEGVFKGQTPKQLKAAKNSFQPDKFAKCSEDVRADFQAKAKEIFTVVDRMSQGLADGGKAGGQKAFSQVANNSRKNGKQRGQ